MNHFLLLFCKIVQFLYFISTFSVFTKETNLWYVLIVISADALLYFKNRHHFWHFKLLGGDFHERLEASSTIFDVMIVMNSQNHVVVGLLLPSPKSWSWRPVPTPEGDERPVIFCMTFPKSKDPQLIIFFINPKESLFHQLYLSRNCQLTPNCWKLINPRVHSYLGQKVRKTEENKKTALKSWCAEKLLVVVL